MLFYLGASRPIRRGKIFHNNQPPRKSFFRHFKKFQLSLSFHQLQLDYWTSASMTKGVQVNVAKGKINLHLQNPIYIYFYLNKIYCVTIQP